MVGIRVINIQITAKLALQFVALTMSMKINEASLIQEVVETIPVKDGQS